MKNFFRIIGISIAWLAGVILGSVVLAAALAICGAVALAPFAAPVAIVYLIVTGCAS